MKQRYTITVAGYEMKILSDEDPEDINESVAALERSIRAITARCRTVPLTEAVFLAALSAYADKRKAIARIHELEAELECARKCTDKVPAASGEAAGEIHAPADESSPKKDTAANAGNSENGKTEPAAETPPSEPDGENGNADNAADTAPGLDDLEKMLRERLNDAT